MRRPQGHPRCRDSTGAESSSFRACSVRCHRPGEISGRLLHITDGDQAGARIADRLLSRRRLRRQRQAQLQSAFEHRQRLGLRADLGCQLTDIVISLPERGPRFPVSLYFEQFLQPLIKGGRPVEQLGSQAVKLSSLSSKFSLTWPWKVLMASSASANRARSRSLAASEGPVGPLDLLNREGQVEVGRPELGVGIGLDDEHRP